MNTQNTYGLTRTNLGDGIYSLEDDQCPLDQDRKYGLLCTQGDWLVEASQTWCHPLYAESHAMSEVRAVVQAWARELNENVQGKTHPSLADAVALREMNKKVVEYHQLRSRTKPFAGEQTEEHKDRRLASLIAATAHPRRESVTKPKGTPTVTEWAEAPSFETEKPAGWMPHYNSVPDRCIMETTAAWLEAHGAEPDCIAKVLGTCGLYLLDLTGCETHSTSRITKNGEGLYLADARVVPVHLTMVTKSHTVLLVLTGLTVQGFELSRV